MALTRDFKKTVMKRIEHDHDFARALLREAIDLILDGDSAVPWHPPSFTVHIGSNIGIKIGNNIANMVCVATYLCV